MTVTASSFSLSNVALNRAGGLVATEDGNAVRLWNIDPARAAAQICQTIGGPLPLSDWRRYDLTEIAYTPICPGPAA